jgi:hypothetical protein
MSFQILYKEMRHRHGSLFDIILFSWLYESYFVVWSYKIMISIVRTVTELKKLKV